MKSFCRCRLCNARIVLSRHPDDYIKPKKCGCGGTYRIDKWQSSRPWRKLVCNCDGYHFSHRISSPYCRFRKDGSLRVLGDTDFKTLEDETDNQKAHTHPRQ